MNRVGIQSAGGQSAIVARSRLQLVKPTLLLNATIFRVKSVALTHFTDLTVAPDALTAMWITI